jgi:hypothetical protein
MPLKANNLQAIFKQLQPATASIASQLPKAKRFYILRAIRD